MKQKLSVIVLLSILSLSCSSDEANNSTDATAINLVTGVNFRQSPDDMSFLYGNPNALVNNKFTIFPNPVNEVMYISVAENITDIWFVPANAEKIHQDVNFTSILNSNLYSEQSINSLSDYTLSGQFPNNVKIDVENLEKGYYRVFVKIGGKIYWDNLYKYGNDNNNEEEIIPLLDFWN